MNIELHRRARLRALAHANDGIRNAPRQAVSLGATAVLFAGALAACGGTPAVAGGATATAIVPLVVYSAQGYDSVMTKAFQKATGIPVKLDDDSTGPLLAKVAAESNNPQWGLLWVDGDTAFASLDKQGQLLDYAPPVTLTSVAQSLVPADHSYIPASTTVMAAVIYNAAKVSAVPATYQDLLQSQYKGRVGMNDPSQSGPTFPFIAGLMDQFGGTARGGRPGVVPHQAEGERPAGLPDQRRHTPRARDRGDRLRDDPELRRDGRGDQGHEERDVRPEGRVPSKFNAVAG